MQFVKASAIACFLSVFSFGAQASVINIDFDTAANGDAIADYDVISGQYASLGVHFNAFEDGNQVDSSAMPGGMTTFSTNSWYNFDANWLAADVMTITFDSAVENLQWLASVGGMLSGELINFIAYDSMGTILEQLSISSSDTTSLNAHMGFSASGITKVEMFQPSDGWYWGIDDLSFSFVPQAPGGSGDVPLPATALLLGLGLAGIAVGRRKA